MPERPLSRRGTAGRPLFRRGRVDRPQRPENRVHRQHLPLDLSREAPSDPSLRIDDERGRPGDVDRVESQEPVDSIGPGGPSLLVDGDREGDRIPREVRPDRVSVLADHTDDGGSQGPDPPVVIPQLRDPPEAGRSPGSAQELDDARSTQECRGVDDPGDPREHEPGSGRSGLQEPAHGLRPDGGASGSLRLHMSCVIFHDPSFWRRSRTMYFPDSDPDG